jgi:hypothetical protein
LEQLFLLPVCLVSNSPLRAEFQNFPQKIKKFLLVSTKYKFLKAEYTQPLGSSFQWREKQDTHVYILNFYENLANLPAFALRYSKQADKNFGVMLGNEALQNPTIS